MLSCHPSRQLKALIETRNTRPERVFLVGAEFKSRNGAASGAGVPPARDGQAVRSTLCSVRDSLAELGELAVNTGIWPLYEIECGKLKLYGKTEQIANGRFKRLPVRDYLLKQGRFAHFIDDDIDYFQSKIDEMWNKWLVPGIIPLQKDIEADNPPSL